MYIPKLNPLTFLKVYLDIRFKGPVTELFYYLVCVLLLHSNAKSITKKQYSEAEGKNGVYKEIKQTMIFSLVILHTPKRFCKIQRRNTLSARMQAFNTFFSILDKAMNKYQRSIQKWGHLR